VVRPVVFEDQPPGPVEQVHPCDLPPVRIAQHDLHLGPWQPRPQKSHPRTRLHGRLCGRLGQLDSPSQPRDAFAAGMLGYVATQVVEGCQCGMENLVEKDDRLDQILCAAEVARRSQRRGDAEASTHDDLVVSQRAASHPDAGSRPDGHAALDRHLDRSRLDVHAEQPVGREPRERGAGRQPALDRAQLQLDVVRQPRGCVLSSAQALPRFPWRASQERPFALASATKKGELASMAAKHREQRSAW
jgi:hypothetical protein